MQAKNFQQAPMQDQRVLLRSWSTLLFIVVPLVNIFQQSRSNRTSASTRKNQLKAHTPINTIE